MNGRLPHLVLALSFAAAFVALPTVGRAEPPLRECTLTVTPKPGVSHISKSHTGILSSSSSLNSGNGTKTITRSLEWSCDVRIRSNRPERIEVRAFYLGLDEKGSLVQLGTDKQALALDKNGRAHADLKSPTTRQTKSHTTTTSRHSGGSAGFRSTKSTTHGDRVTGCVIQLFADGKLAKSWSSDSRWVAEAEKEDFSVASLRQRSGRIGLR